MGPHFSGRYLTGRSSTHQIPDRAIASAPILDPTSSTFNLIPNQLESEMGVDALLTIVIAETRLGSC
jgi:hypothetical protein